MEFQPANLLFFTEPACQQQKKEACLHTSLKLLKTTPAFFAVNELFALVRNGQFLASFFSSSFQNITAIGS